MTIPSLVLDTWAGDANTRRSLPSRVCRLAARLSRMFWLMDMSLCLRSTPPHGRHGAARLAGGTRGCVKLVIDDEPRRDPQGARPPRVPHALARPVLERDRRQHRARRARAVRGRADR